MITLLKDWDRDQLATAYTALKAHSDAQVGHPARSPLSLDHVMVQLINQELNACFIDGYLVIYEFGPSWCSPESWLYELLVTKAAPAGTFSDYVTGLRQLAAMHDCTAIYTGNSVLRPGLRRLYERSGFIPISESYYMEVPNGRNQESYPPHR